MLSKDMRMSEWTCNDNRSFCQLEHKGSCGNTGKVFNLMLPLPQIVSELIDYLIVCPGIHILPSRDSDLDTQSASGVCALADDV